MTGHSSCRRMHVAGMSECSIPTNFLQLFTFCESITYLMSLKMPHSTCQMPGLLFQRLNQFKCQIQTDWRRPSGIPRWDFSRKKIKDISTVRGFQVIAYTPVSIQRSNAPTLRQRHCFSRSLCFSSPGTSAPPRCTHLHALLSPEFQPLPLSRSHLYLNL